MSKKKGYNAEYTYSNETFSGCDIVASISMNLEQEDDNGNITVAPFTEIIGELQTISYSINMDKKPVRAIGNNNVKDYTIGPRTIAGSLVFSVFNKHFAENVLSKINSSYKKGRAFLVDELPPFNINLSFANEYGFRSRLNIYGVRLLNEGQVMSINDIYTENTYQFFAIDLEYLSDEMSSAWDSTKRKYVIKDKNVETNKYDETQNQIKEILRWNATAKEEFLSYMNEDIKLTTITRDARSANAKGFVDIYAEPPQKSGSLYLTNEMSEEKVYKIGSQSSVDLHRLLLSTSIEPGLYKAHFINDTNKKVSKSVAFKIEEFVEKKANINYAPIIDFVGDSFVEIIAMDSNHNVAELYDSSMKFIESKDLDRNRVTFFDLTSATEYRIKTKNKLEDIPSESVLVKTLDTYDVLFNEVENMLIANMGLLALNDMKRYKAIINEAKQIAINSKQALPIDALNVVKSKAKNILKTSKNEDEKEEALLTINIVNEILNISMKITNDYSSSLNEEVIVPIPEAHLNARYENILTFDPTITEAEIYRRYNNVSTLDQVVKSMNFKTIGEFDNAFRFVGRAGYSYYVEAVREGKHSQKVEFYSLTEKEKEFFITRDANISKMTDKDKEIIDETIDVPILSSEYKQKFMLKAKNIDNAKIFAPDVYSIDKNIIIQTGIKDVFGDFETKDFYIAIANYDDIVNNKLLYKVKFTNKSDFITIYREFHGIKDNEDYIVWIEDSNNIQISNPVSLTYVNGFDSYEDGIKDYENEIYLKPIVDSISKYLDNEQYNSLIGDITNNQDITNRNALSYMMYRVKNMGIRKESLVYILKLLSHYVGIIGSPERFIDNINYDQNLSRLTFNSLYNGKIILYNIDNDFNIVSTDVGMENEFYLDVSKIIVCIDKDMNRKSNVIYINEKSNTMEVF